MTEKIQEKNISDLKIQLTTLYKKKLQLNLEKGNNPNFKTTHLIKKNKKDLARTLTYISQKVKHEII